MNIKTNKLRNTLYILSAAFLIASLLFNSLPTRAVLADHEEKITICHFAGLASDPANYFVMELPPVAVWGAHLDESTGTGIAGHEQDFVINNLEDLARCAPPATPSETPSETPTDTPTEEGKITICHIAGLASDPANYVVQELPPSAVYGAHLDESTGTGIAGHEDDFIINNLDDLARCAPAGTPTETPTETPTGTPTETPTETPTGTPTEEGKITICHIAGLASDPANYVVQELPPSAVYGAHLDESTGTGIAGHEDDFIINNLDDLARCAPPATPTPTETPTETPTLTPTELAGLEVTAYCLGPDAANFGWRVSNPNDFLVDFEWRVNGSVLAGIGSVAASSTYDFSTPKTVGTIMMLYVGGELLDTTTGREDCLVETETPDPTEPPTVITLLAPPVGAGPTVLIPVTGFGDETPVSLPTILFNLGFGFFGLGMVAHGMNRRRVEKYINVK